ncbi:MAG: neutral/alkaline non-lysosomal ceramidase N-terminal domain-containing protein [Bacteroidales bacterium]|nr:neutral/alkaline non-lysosomal ceramidase N-terminal domain-containing protein [Bacteroidales bacterium]
MKKVFIGFILFLLPYLTIQAISSGSSLKVGVGETVITPSGNVLMEGFARSQKSTGVHDDLHARSMVVEDTSGNVSVLMTVSLIGMSRQLADRIREGIKVKTGISGDKVIITATHTHSGPGLGSGNDDRSSYRDLLVAKCVESVVIAWENRVPGRIGIESTEVSELGRNRRRLLYGGIHPDPEVAVIKIENAEGKLLGVAFNYGCHPSGLDWSNTLISEDWPYFAIRKIKEAVGENVWVAYYQSAQGNINVGYSAELSAVGAEMPVRSYWYIEKKGGQMADAVLKALPSIKTSNNQAVKTARDYFDYPLRENYPITVRDAEKDVNAAKARLAYLEERPEFNGTRTLDNARVEVFSTNQRLDGARKFYANGPHPKTRTLEQQAVRIGNAVFVTFPGELFAEIGLRIKNDSPYNKTYVIGVTAGEEGYLPAAREFIDGDYEVDGSDYGPQTEDACMRFSLDLIERVID